MLPTNDFLPILHVKGIEKRNAVDQARNGDMGASLSAKWQQRPSLLPRELWP